MKIRCYMPPELWTSSVVQLKGKEAHHLIHVLRVAAGDEIVCFDGEGNEAQATVQSMTRRELSLKLEDKKKTLCLPYRVSLAAAIPGNVKFDQIVDQATQLGIFRIIPVLTQRTVVRIPEKERAKKQSRWNEVARAAGKQSGVSRLPIVDRILAWNDLVRTLSGYEKVFIAAIEGPHENLSVLLEKKPMGEILIMIGPEGDFTNTEIDQAVNAGAHRFTLGLNVLRCETAAVVAMALVSSSLWERSGR